jgi:LPS O-antigen subunit length determinant protein (WzzB/FepE family)
MNNQNLNLFDVFKVLWKWRKTVSIIMIVALVASIIVSLLMPNYYKSTAIFYAANPAMNDRQNLFREQAGNLPLEYFGTESDVDRVLQICKSGAINGYIINKYHLGSHYKIDSTAKYYATKVREEFKENSSMVRNELGAIEVTIWDTDAKTAAEISNDIVATADNINKQFFISNNEKSISLMKKNKEEKQIEVNHLTDTLTYLRSHNASSDVINTLDMKKQNAIKDLGILNKLYEQFESAANNDFTTVNSIERAYASEKKDKPLRSLIIIATLLITLLITTISLIILEKWKSIKPQLEN